MKPTYNSALYGILTLAYGWGGEGGGESETIELQVWPKG